MRFREGLERIWPEIASSENRLAVAVSGGPDSLALLLLSAIILPERVEAATVDHGLRPESADEAVMVARVCENLGVPHRILETEVGAGNLQAQARLARYRALSEWIADRGLAALATGHQLDDQAETMVMRLNRGSGLAGLAGVRARGKVPGTQIPLLRPLLGWRRSELEDLVRSAAIAPVRDPSNADMRFDRVRARRMLAEVAALQAAGLARSAQLLAEAEDFLASQIDRLWDEKVIRTDAGFLYAAKGASAFEAVEIAIRIAARLEADFSRSDARELVERLRAGANASLGGILVCPEDGANWNFAPEPPRNTG